MSDRPPAVRRRRLPVCADGLDRAAERGRRDRERACRPRIDRPDRLLAGGEVLADDHDAGRPPSRCPLRPRRRRRASCRRSRASRFAAVGRDGAIGTGTSGRASEPGSAASGSEQELAACSSRSSRPTPAPQSGCLLPLPPIASASREAAACSDGEADERRQDDLALSSRSTRAPSRRGRCSAS